MLIQTLGNRHDTAALPALFAAAKDGPTPVRLAAIRALPEIGDPAELPTLLELMRSTDKEISTAAQESLAALQGKPVDDAGWQCSLTPTPPRGSPPWTSSSAAA